MVVCPHGNRICYTIEDRHFEIRILTPRCENFLYMITHISHMARLLRQMSLLILLIINRLPKVQIRGRGVTNLVASRLWVIDITWPVPDRYMRVIPLFGFFKEEFSLISGQFFCKKSIFAGHYFCDWVVLDGAWVDPQPKGSGKRVSVHRFMGTLCPRGFQRWRGVHPWVQKVF